MLYLDLKVVFTVVALLIATAIIACKVIVETKRDLHPIALGEQANVGPTRKENETAIYRNFTVPPGFPLTTGMGLSMGYRLRNGNFGDIWSSIMSLSNENYVEIDNQKHSLGELNAIAKHLCHTLMPENETGRLGISSSVYKYPGFALTIAGFMGSLRGLVPVILHSVPRSKQNLDALAIESWDTFHQMNGSHEWYKMVIVCNSTKGQRPNAQLNNVVTWEELISELEEDQQFEYAPPKDNSHDSKVIFLSSSPYGFYSSFTHMALVSSIAAYIKSFPMDNELSGKDHLSIVVEEKTDSYDPTQIMPKLLATLLHGGSASILSPPSGQQLDQCMNKSTTLLQIAQNSPLLDSLLDQSWNLPQRLKLAWASNLLSEGVFTSSALAWPSLKNLRCVYLADQVKDVKSVITMHFTTINSDHAPKKSRSTETLNRMRALLGSRVVVELYSPYVVLGPIASTNFFDYRVFPSQVDSKLTKYGPICTSLEAKLVKAENSPQYLVTDRQGMLCIRGFTIGRPVEEHRQKTAFEIVEKFDGGEGWMPMVGVFCLWGKDGCLYEFK
ncbi:LANO_0H10110g1_1 [Lachancea nothofagi CBS 11611]|uniref:LANO_0H10110g1_1 n=1 Tax=Lachancea nothofagi CBS 11611 TaxID=1266666 RepID=A0A1G4KM32_9SACH|nr:LANO_0H10110g1_1 [Lachancea nothofagi CBS 11611]